MRGIKAAKDGDLLTLEALYKAIGLGKLVMNLLDMDILNALITCDLRPVQSYGLRCLKYMHEHGCPYFKGYAPWSEEEIRKAKGIIECVSYARKHNLWQTSDNQPKSPPTPDQLQASEPLIPASSRSKHVEIRSSQFDIRQTDTTQISDRYEALCRTHILNRVISS